MTGCQTLKSDIPNFSTYVTLHATGECHRVETITYKEEILSEEKCEYLKARAIFLTSEDWAIIKKALLKGCFTNECTQFIGRVDSVFKVLDESAKVMLP